MQKIATPQDLAAKLQRLLAYSQGPEPSRAKIASQLRTLAAATEGDFENHVATRNVRLTPKEITRASDGYTIVVRPQSDGGYWVSAVKIEGTSGRPLGAAFEEVAESKGGVSAAVKEVARWMDKMGIPGQMGAASRGRLAAVSSEAKRAFDAEIMKGLREELSQALRSITEPVFDKLSNRRDGRFDAMLLRHKPAGMDDGEFFSQITVLVRKWYREKLA